MATESRFTISPERRASTWHYWYRQLFVTAPPVTRQDVDLSGKTAIVTGANSGIGLEAARQILDLGGKVILAVRDESKGETARQTLSKNRNPSTDSIQVWKLDLSSYDSILAFAERAKTLDPLDIAVFNAGIFKTTESFAATTGYEEAVQVNYLSTVLLTILLTPIIKAKKTGSGPGHICIVTSEAAAWAKFDQRHSSPILPAFKQKSTHWDPVENYRTSKLLGLLFVTELVKHVSASDVVVNCANPGFCVSELGREVSGVFRLVFKVQLALLARTCEVGARTLVHAVTTLGERSHGQYVEDGKMQP